MGRVAENSGSVAGAHTPFCLDSPWFVWLLAIGFAIVTVLIYLPARRHGFCGLDDNFYIVENPNIQSTLSWHTVKWAVTDFGMVNWIPFTWLSYAVGYQFFGLHPAGYHMLNVVLHAVNVVVLFWVLKRATGYAWRSLAVAALFALHPMNVEPVVWIAELKTVLSTLFFLLAIEAYRRYAETLQLHRYAMVVLLYGLGLLAKPQIIMLPFLLLLWDYWPLQRMFPAANPHASEPGAGKYRARNLLELVKEKIPLFFVGAVDALAAFKTQSHWPWKPALSLRLENAVVSYFLYVKKAFWPTKMAPEYPHLGIFLTRLQVLGAVVFLLAVTVAVLAARRHRYLPVGWFWFLVSLIPTIGIKQVGLQGMADRYAYGSYLGLFIMVCWGLSDLAQRRRLSPAWLAAGSAAALLMFALITARQITYWQDEWTLWSHAANAVDHHWLADDNVGTILMSQGRNEEALSYFMRASNAVPGDSYADFQIAYYRQSQGNMREAIIHYQRALQDYGRSLTPKRRSQIWINMGVAYRDLGDEANARRCFAEGLKAKQ